MPAPRFVLDDFWPSDLFLGGIPGAWYDPTDLSTMFQDSAGTTPVTAVEQPVGLILDKSQGLTLGAELVTNGDFSGGATGWSVNAGATLSVSGGVLRVTTAAGGVAYVTQSFATTVGKTYRVEATIVTLGPVFTGVRKSDNATASSNVVTIKDTTGAGSGVFVATAATTFIVLQSNTVSAGQFAEFDNISVRELAGNHASQSTAASRPTYRARYNALTQSEDFSQAVWTKTSSTVSANTSVAPDGTTTADTLAEAAAVSFHGANHQSVSVPAGTTLTLSASFKKGTSRYAQLNFGGSGAVSRWVSCVIDLDTGSITQSSAGAQATLVSAVSSAQGNGWYRVSLTGSVQTDTSIFSYVNMVSTGTPTLGSYGVETYLGVITNNILIWGAQLLTAADVTATGNAYQRIAAATVYDTAPVFRPYLAFDGMDDSLSTAVIPGMSSIDKATFFGGATKLTDGAYPVIFEYGVRGIVGSIGLYASPGTARYSFILEGSTIGSYDPQTYAAPITNVLTGSFDIGGATLADEIKPRINGVLNQTNGSGSSGTGNFGAYSLFIGRRNNASLPFNGRIYEFIFRGAASSTTEIIDTETWVNARTGGF